MDLKMKSRYQALLEKLHEYAMSQIEEGIYIPQWGMSFADFEKMGAAKALEKATEAQERLQERKVEAKMAREEKRQPSRIDEAFNIIDEIENKFITSTECNVLLITGDAGSGKSSLSKQLVKALWEKHDKRGAREGHPIPLCVELLKADTAKIDLLADYLSHVVGCIPEEMQLIRETAVPIVLVLDGVDEISPFSPAELLSQIKRALWPNKFKIIMTSRRLGGSLVETFNIADQIEEESLSYHILPFTGYQVKQYLTHYSHEQAEKSRIDLQTVLKSMPGTMILETTTTILALLYAYYSPWTLEQYEQALKMMPEVSEFATNPYMLKQVAEAEVLPAIIEEHTQEEKAHRVKLTYSDIYGRFTKHYFKRQLEKHPVDLFREFTQVTHLDKPGDFKRRIETIKSRHGLPDKYKVTPMTDRITSLEKGNVYVREKSGKLTYSVINPFGIEIRDETIDSMDAPIPADLKELEPALLAITAKNGHTIPNDLNEFFPILLQIYNQKLAYDLFINRKLVINYKDKSSEENINSSYGQVYFEVSHKISPYYPFSRLLHLYSPIKHLGNNCYTFLHKSLLEFFAARYLFNSALTRSWVKIGRDLNAACLLDEPLSVIKTPIIHPERDSLSVESKEEKKPATTVKKMVAVESDGRSVELTELKKTAIVDISDLKRTVSLVPKEEKTELLDCFFQSEDMACLPYLVKEKIRFLYKKILKKYKEYPADILVPAIQAVVTPLIQEESKNGPIEDIFIENLKKKVVAQLKSKPSFSSTPSPESAHISALKVIRRFQPKIYLHPEVGTPSVSDVITRRPTPDLGRRAAMSSNNGTAGSVVDYLANMAKSDAEFREILLEIIHISKHVPYVWRAAANAMTILSRAGCNFGGMGFRGIRIGGVEEDGRVWGANLSRGLCDRTDFGGGDLRGVNFTDAWIARVNFSDACMEGAFFGELAHLVGGKAFYSIKENKLMIFGLDRNFSKNIDYKGRLDGDGELEFKIAIAITNPPNYNFMTSSSIRKIYEYSYYFSERCWPDKIGDTQIAVRTDSKQFAWAHPYSPHRWVSTKIDGKTNTIQLCSIETGKTERKLEGHTDEVCSLSYQPNGNLLASGSKDCSIILWQTSTGDCWRLLEGHSTSVISLNYSADGSLLFSGDGYGTLRVWETNTGYCLQKIATDSCGITSQSFNPNSEQLASGHQNGAIKLWKRKSVDEKKGHSKQPPLSLDISFKGNDSAVRCLNYRSDGLELVAGNEDQTVRLWTIKGDCIQVLEGHSRPIESVCYTSNHLLASGDGQMIRLWSPLKRVSKSLSHVHTRPISSISYRFDGRQIATAAKGDHAIRLWSLETGECSRILKGHTGEVTCLSYRPGSLQLASGSDDDTVRLWSVNDGKCVNDIALGSYKKNKDHYHSVSVVCLDFRPDGNEMVIGVGEVIILWSLTGGINKIFDSKYDLLFYSKILILSLHYRPDAERLAIGREKLPSSLFSKFSLPSFTAACRDDLTITPYEKELKDEINATAACVKYRPDGRQLAIGYVSHNAILRLGDKKQELPSRATHLDFSPDSKLLASTDNSQKLVKIWSTEGADCQCAFEMHHPTEVQHVKWSPLYKKVESKSENNYTTIYSLVSGSKEGAVRVWQIDQVVIQRRKKYEFVLLWQTHSTLFSKGALLMGTMGLGKTNYKLLIQRGAKRGNQSTIGSLDAMSERDSNRWSHPTAVLPPSNYTLNNDSWVVVLAREIIPHRSMGPHAMLILQGIDFNRELRQHFIVIKEIHFWEKAAIEIRDTSLKKMTIDASNLAQKSFPISRVKADKLLMNVVRDQRNRLNYAYLGSKFFRPTYYNCLTYCEAKLREIDINPGEKTLFDRFVAAHPVHHLPASAENSRCVIA
jgi:WD40 repeat protein